MSLSIFDDICHDDAWSLDDVFDSNLRYRAQDDEKQRFYNKLASFLDDDQQKVLEGLKEHIRSCERELGEAAFKKGFSVGVRMIVEVYNTKVQISRVSRSDLLNEREKRQKQDITI